MKRTQTAIIGGGAAGLFCAAALNCGRDVLVIERGDRVGRKLSATGNGQGNVTHTGVSPARYFVCDPASSANLGKILSRYGEKEMLAFLEDCGGLFLPDERGRIYPAGRQASSVTDLLRYALARKEVCVVSETKVVSLKKADGEFRIEAETPAGRQAFFADNVVLCAGGKAAKNFGTDGNGYRLAESVGHTITPLYPSLVQLKTDTAPIKGLKGIRAEAAVKAFAGGGKIAEERGDVIFTEYGVSGDAVFRISAFLTDKLNKEDVALSLAFLPDVDEGRLSEILARRAANESGIPESETLCGILNNQLGRAVMRRCKDKSPCGVARAVKAFTLSVTGTLGFDYAQVTKGGIPLKETDENLQSKLVKGLYFAGEILDADGECGGYNLQWAYSSAATVAEALNARYARR